jgi:hypothetical protein
MSPQTVAQLIIGVQSKTAQLPSGFFGRKSEKFIIFRLKFDLSAENNDCQLHKRNLKCD